MKKGLIVFFIMTLLTGGVIAYTGWLSGAQQDHTDGYHTVRPDYDGHMMDLTGAHDQEFSAETTDMGTESINDICEYKDINKLEENSSTESYRNTYREVEENCW